MNEALNVAWCPDYWVAHQGAYVFWYEDPADYGVALDLQYLYDLLDSPGLALVPIVFHYYPMALTSDLDLLRG